MKYNTKQIISTLLILLIGLNSISSSSLAIKSHSNRRTHTNTLSKRNKNKTNTKDNSIDNAKTIIQKIEDKVQTPIHIAFFTMGILSNWFPKVEDIYIKIKDLHYFFNPCYKLIKKTWAMIKGHSHSEETDPAEIEKYNKKQAKIQEEIAQEEDKIAEFEKKDDETSDKKKKEICKETKELIHKIWLKTVDEYFEYKSKNEKSAYVGGSHSIPPERYCKYPLLPDAPKAHKIIKKNFESQEEFYDICIRLRETGDCGNYQPDNKGAWYFLKKTLKFTLFMKNGAQCVFHMIKVGGKDDESGTPANQEVMSMADSALGTWEVTKTLFKEFGALILHVLSFGIWGALRAAWNIIKLTLKIYIMVKHFLFDLPFNLGKLVGTGIKIMKAFIAGRRRK